MTMTDTSIEWTDASWNPVRGCSRVNPDCDHCYAMGQAHRFSGPGKPYEGLTTIRAGKVDWSGVARFVTEALAAPLSWRNPRKVFVNSMSDLFHHSVTNEEIAAVFGVMAACPQHTFQILTKRPARARQWFKWLDSECARRLSEAPPRDPGLPPFELKPRDRCAQIARAHGMSVGALPKAYNGPWPLPNVWVGVSCGHQRAADEFVPVLLTLPAAVRFVSAEPLTGPITFEFLQPNDPPTEINALRGTHGVLRPHGGTCPRLDWLIVGGESGPGARPCRVDWIESIVAQCKLAGVPAFVKQLGARPLFDKSFQMRLDDRKGGDPVQWPEALRVREFPGASP
jgi:protein gp37